MEKIAITIWNDVVSPLYDASCCLLIIGNCGQQTTVDVRKLSISRKADACKERDVSILICGAISTIAYEILLEREIEVISWIRGSVDEVIAAYINGEDIRRCYGMPGSNQRRGRQQKGFCQRKRKCRNKDVDYGIL